MTGQADLWRKEEAKFYMYILCKYFTSNLDFLRGQEMDGWMKLTSLRHCYG